MPGTDRVVRGDTLDIEYRDNRPTKQVKFKAVRVDWDKPSDRLHRAVNVGKQSYQELTVFFLKKPGAKHQGNA